MAGDKVRCAVCKFQAKAFCLKKKVKVALNKRRKCDLFKIDPSRVRLKQQLPATRIPPKEVLKDMRKEYKKRLKEEAARQESLKNAPQPSVDYSSVLKTGNVKHPLTGDLSRFTSTAGKDE
jgi:hypothetical protein